MNNSDETILSEETLLKKNSHTLHELIEGFGDNATDNTKIIKEKFKRIAPRYHPDKHPEDLKVVFEGKFNALNEFRNKIKAGGYTAETIKNLITNYPNQDNPSSPNQFNAQRTHTPTQKTEYKPIDPIKPEDKKFFESFKNNYAEGAKYIYDYEKLDDAGLEKYFVSFRERRYEKFSKKLTSIGGIQRSTYSPDGKFDKTAVENFIFFPDQTDPGELLRFTIILKSYKQAVSENNIAKPDDLTQNIKKDEYGTLQLKKDFLANYIKFNTSGKNNDTYIQDRFIERFNLYQKTGDIKPIEKFTFTESDVADKAFNTLLDKTEAKAFLEKLRAEYLKQQERENKEREERENKEREERENKEREERESIQARWSEFCKNILKSKEDAYDSVASYCDTHLKKLGDSTDNLKIWFDSSWSSVENSASENWGKTLTNFKSLPSINFTLPELPQIHFSWNIPDNSKTDEPDSNSKKRPREEADKEPKEDQWAKKRARTEEGENAGQNSREEATESARKAAEKAREAVKEAQKEIERARREKGKVASQGGTNDNSNKSPTSQPPEPKVAFFGTKAREHKKATPLNRRNPSSVNRKPRNTTSLREKSSLNPVNLRRR